MVSWVGVGDPEDEEEGEVSIIPSLCGAAPPSRGGRAKRRGGLRNPQLEIGTRASALLQVLVQSIDAELVQNVIRIDGAPRRREGVYLPTKLKELDSATPQSMCTLWQC